MSRFVIWLYKEWRGGDSGAGGWGRPMEEHVWQHECCWVEGSSHGRLTAVVRECVDGSMDGLMNDGGERRS